MTDTVLAWDVLDGDILGAVVECRACPCRSGTGCDGTRRLHRPYRLPGGAHIDLYRDADILVNVLDRAHQSDRAQPDDNPPASDDTKEA